MRRSETWFRCPLPQLAQAGCETGAPLPALSRLRSQPHDNVSDVNKDNESTTMLTGET